MMKIGKLKKNFICVIALFMTTLTIGVTSFALVAPDSFYDSMSWTWYYNAPATNEEVTMYLKSKGYSTSDSSITHFSKVTGESWCRAKWGGLERMDHASYDPYYSSSSYGSIKTIYYK
jgi:hypothetical protein